MIAEIPVVDFIFKWSTPKAYVGDSYEVSLLIYCESSNVINNILFRIAKEGMSYTYVYM